jgi:hypothetical protein
MNISTLYLLVLWLVVLPLGAVISAAVAVANDKRGRHGQGRSISR